MQTFRARYKAKLENSARSHDNSSQRARLQETLQTLRETEARQADDEKTLCDYDVLDYLKLNRTAVNVRVYYRDMTAGTVARIDGMSAGCFVSPRLLDKLDATATRSRNLPIFDCPEGEIKVEGTVDLVISWANKYGKRSKAKIRLNVPVKWKLDVDILVTVPWR